jgi:hypothetical protein
MDVAELDDLTFTCPRCHNETSAKFYGPCAVCCEELRATQGSGARDVEVAAYEPKMNVVPNQIASKE